MTKEAEKKFRQNEQKEKYIYVETNQDEKRTNEEMN